MSLISGKINTFKACKNIYGGILVGFSFLLLTLITVKTFAPEVKSEAANQTASQTVGPYTMSMSNDSVATVNITPTNTQTVYTGTNNLSVTNTCDAGATITMTTNSTSSNSLTRSATNSDTLTKDIAATTTTGLDNNSWGYALNNSSTYYAVPKKGTTAATIYNATAAQTSALTVPVKFGVKTDNNLPSGTYSNDVVYTMTPKSGCLSYSVTWNYDGGTAKSGATYPTSLSWGQTVNLSTLTPTKSGYTFAGWTNGTSTFTGSETAANLNSVNAKSITVTAKWTATCPSGETCVDVDLAVNGSKGFDYTGNVQAATLKKAGYYKLEVWGAQGGTIQSNQYGGYGGYSYGVIQKNQNDIIYIVVGQQGGRTKGGYNGGGSANGNNNVSTDAYGGGGATHISTRSGLLNTLSSYKTSIFIVAGGGGGDSKTNEQDSYGGHGGGYIGGNGFHWQNASDSLPGNGGSQTTGGAAPTGNGASGLNGGFGYGGNGVSYSSNYSGGGGSGFYGGSSGAVCNSGHRQPGGGGSGYIGNSLLLSAKGVTKQMYMYNSGCTSSTATATKTTCTSSTGAHVANAANTGDGYAKITYLGT